MAAKEAQKRPAEEEKEEEEVEEAEDAEDAGSDEDEGSDGGSNDWSDGTDDDADFERVEGKRAKLAVAATTAACEFWPIREYGQKDAAKEKAKEETAEKVASELLASAESVQKLWISGGGSRWCEVSKFELLPRQHRILDASCKAMLHSLQVLRVDNFPGAGDPVFGTRREMARRKSASQFDLFSRLAKAMKGTKCQLRKLTLQGGFHSARSLCDFFKAAQPPLQSFRCRQTLFHGRNFAPIVEAMKASLPDSGSLVEFETDAYIGGEDPFGLLADAFPKLQVLKVGRMYSQKSRDAALAKLGNLKRKKCKLAKENRALRGNCAVSESGLVGFFISSDHHDDGYRGQGLFWDELDNTCECMESWAVGRGVTRDMVLRFMAECGIAIDESLDEEECGLDDLDCSEEEGEAADIVVQVSAKALEHGLVELAGANLAGEAVVTLKVDPKSTALRVLLEDVAAKCDCAMLDVKAVFPNGVAAQMADGEKLLDSLLN